MRYVLPTSSGVSGPSPSTITSSSWDVKALDVSAFLSSKDDDDGVDDNGDGSDHGRTWDKAGKRGHTNGELKKEIDRKVFEDVLATKKERARAKKDRATSHSDLKLSLSNGHGKHQQQDNQINSDTESNKKEGEKEKAVREERKERAAAARMHALQLSPRSISLFTSSQAASDPVGNRPRLNSTDGEIELPRRGLCEEMNVWASYRWEADWGRVEEADGKGGKKYGKRKPIGPGFENLGNTCFLNSTMQCLAYCPVFAQCLVGGADSQASSNNNSSSSNNNNNNNNNWTAGSARNRRGASARRRTNPHKIKAIVRNLLSRCHLSPSNSSTKPFSPTALVNNLRHICPSFRPCRQEVSVSLTRSVHEQTDIHT